MSNDHIDDGLDLEAGDAADRDARIGSDESDDLPSSPPDAQPRATEREMAGMPEGEETIEQRIMQEEPDPTSTYGAPDNESGLGSPARVGGDDPDAIDVEDDFLGDSAQGRRDVDSTDAGDVSAEESAIHAEGHEEL